MEPIIPFEPVASVEIPTDGQWLFQVKWDGVRVLVYYDGETVKLFNRKKNERTFHYPEIAEIQSYCRVGSVILDGEAIALGSDGKPSFYEVMKRDGIRRLHQVGELRKTVPVTYMIFDCLYCDGEWIHHRPLTERMEILESIIRPNERIQPVPSYGDGESLFRIIREQGMEGIVAKKKHSPYLIGQKRDLWLKIKNVRDLIAVIGGFTVNGGIVNAILLGLYDEAGRFWYIGHAGTGRMPREDWRKLTEWLRPLVVRERPFHNRPERRTDAFWVKPEITVKVQYSEWTEGRTLRHPSIQGFTDADPRRCMIQDELFR